MKLQLQQEENQSKGNLEDEGDSHRRSNHQRPTTPDEQNSDLLREIRKELDELRNAINEKTDRSVDRMLSNAFLRHFIRGQRPKRPADHLLTIRQGEKETLRLYVKHFTRETLEIDKADDKVQLTTFKAGLRSRKLLASLMKNPPKMMVEMLLKAQKYMNAENALVAIRDVEKPGDKGRKDDECRGQKQELLDHQTSGKNRRKDNKSLRTVKFTPLVMPIDKILTQIKDEHYLKWLRPLHSSLNVRDKNKYCWFHKDHGHYTKDCQDLKEQIEELIQKGKLQKYVKKGEYSKFRDDNKSQHESLSRSDDRSFQPPQDVIGEIKTIVEGPFTRGSFKSLKKRGIEANLEKVQAIINMASPRTVKEVQKLTKRIAALNRFISRVTDKCLPFFKTLKQAFAWIDEYESAF
nr:uncharacterized protein LOC112010573 [Quercus suber]